MSELGYTTDDLKMAIREANDHLLGGEGVDLLYYWPANIAPDLRRIISEVLSTA